MQFNYKPSKLTTDELVLENRSRLSAIQANTTFRENPLRHSHQ